MPAVNHEHLERYFTAWIADPQLPLEVTRARYDNPFPRSWEVMARETPTCDVPIAEFTEWDEAQNWAVKMAKTAAQLGAEVRRYKYGYWPSGTWGGIGYYDGTGEYHEVEDPQAPAQENRSE